MKNETNVPGNDNGDFLRVPASNASAESDGHTLALQGTVPVPSLVLSPYILGVTEAHNYYTDPRNPVGSFNERIRLRNSIVRNLFKKLENERTIQYRNHQVYQRIEARCKHTRPGGHKSCPGQYDFGSSYVIIDGSFGYEGSGIKSHSVAGSVFSWWQRTEGDNTNIAHLWATARLTADGVTQSVARELQELRQQLDARNLPTDQSFDPTEP